MKLSLFTNEQHIDSTSIQATPAQIAKINLQLRSLVPNQMISGEIVARNGGEVQLRLLDNLIINARVDKNINVEIGQNMTFKVKNNGSTLTLSPLFTNVATDRNVLKALEMAGIAVNDTSVEMTNQLMEAGLPVNKNMLQQISHEINTFPQAKVSDVVNLHKLQMPVNEANVVQMVSYRKLTHQIMDGLDSVLKALPDTMNSMLEKGDVHGAVKLYQELFQFVQEGEGMHTEQRQNRELGDTVNANNVNLADKTIMSDAVNADMMAINELDLAENLQIPEREETYIREQIINFAQEKGSVGDLIDTPDKLTNSVNKINHPVSLTQLHNLFSGKEMQELIYDKLRNFWTITPDEVAKTGKVDELYQRLNKQLKGLASMLESVNQTDSAAYKAVSNMNQNLDFLNQVNQMYTYVQLPLKLQQREAHGELYVYTNKKNLAQGDGPISALLHLDMEHLGPVDVYVTMQSKKVNTQFYVRDDEMLSFLEKHMDLLTERLQKKGYHCNVTMTGRGEEENAEGGIESILRKEKGIVLSQYAFDVRT